MRELPLVLGVLILAVAAWIFAVLMAVIQAAAESVSFAALARAARAAKESGVAILRYSLLLIEESSDRNNAREKLKEKN